MVIERFSIECHRTKTKPITYQLDSQSVAKPKPKPKKLSNYFRHSIENRSNNTNDNNDVNNNKNPLYWKSTN